MALDRTWYNSLVDDDGSGLTGSVWDKADVDSLMDAIDAEIARLDGKFGASTFTPTLGTTSGGTPVYASSDGYYYRIGSTVFFSGRVTLASKGSLVDGAQIVMTLPSVTQANHGAGINIGFWNGLAVNIAGLGGYVVPNSPAFFFTYEPASAGGMNTPPLVGAHISNSFDFIFGGTYLG